MKSKWTEPFKNKWFQSIKTIHIIGFVLMMFLSTSCTSMPLNKSETESTVPPSKTEQKLLAENQSTDIAKKLEVVPPPTTVKVNSEIKVHFIDVGQGDAILVQQGTSNMLIDTGTNSSTNQLMNYLKSFNIKKLDYLVLTHPHEDHIGGADSVIKNFDISNLYMPKATSTTKTFKDVVSAMNSKGLKATLPALGSSFKLGEANCTMLGPINSKSDDLNTYSIVLKVTFGNNKFLFTGDAQVSNEQDIINKGFDISADILKVGHHGSHTSTSQAFLDKVNPKYAVISLGKDNDYGHPHQEVMKRLEAKKIPIYRTDEKGTIIAIGDGTNIKFNNK